MGKINEFNNVSGDVLFINNTLLYLIGESIFGIDEYDPWSFNYETLKLLCDAYGELNNFNYIKTKIENVMKLVIKMDYDKGHLVKYDLLEREFKQRINKK